MQSTERDEKIHMGRNVKRFREWKNISQEDLAFELKVTQQSVSLIEQKETIDDALLEQISKILKVPVESIKNIPEDAFYNFINNFNDNSINHGPLNNYHCTFNLLDKFLEQGEENKKLYESKIELYERMLKDKNEMIEKLERLLRN